MRTRIWHSDWKPRWLIRYVSAALLSFMDKQEGISPTPDMVPTKTDALQSAADDLRDLLITYLARSPGARFIVKAIEPALGKAPTPPADRIRAGP